MPILERASFIALPPVFLFDLMLFCVPLYHALHQGTPVKLFLMCAAAQNLRRVHVMCGNIEVYNCVSVIMCTCGGSARDNVNVMMCSCEFLQCGLVLQL